MCGIFGIYNYRRASELVYLGLYSLQHRGQESVGIVTSDGKKFYSEISLGEVAKSFDTTKLNNLIGKHGIGHVRYSTFGVSDIKNAQPIIVKSSKGLLSLAHNGNLVNAKKIRNELERKGAIFQTTTDSEVILHLLARSRKKDLVSSLKWCLNELKGAYSLILLTLDSIYAIRDPYGFRPLFLGKLRDSYVFASETCAFDIIGAEFVREVKPGEIILITDKTIESINFSKKVNEKFCIFEYVYFSRPDSFIHGKSVHEVRKKFGEILSEESKVDADIVISVPDSANSCAIGYALKSKLPYDTGLIRNHYIGRTFIQPKQKIRNFSTKIKYNPVKDLLKGKRVVVVDDSIVRGTTAKKLINLLREAGVKEIHYRISCPPIISPCYYGIDTPTKKELIAANHSVEEIRRMLNLDSLHYLSLEGMIRATSLSKERFCLACFNGDYPVK